MKALLCWLSGGHDWREHYAVSWAPKQGPLLLYRACQKCGRREMGKGWTA